LVSKRLNPIPGSTAPRILLMSAALIAIAACTSAPPPPVVDASRPAAGRGTGDQQDEKTTLLGRPAPPQNTATLALLDESAAAGEAGDHQRAVGYLERAIRLEPRDARLWIALAEQHIKLGQWQIGKQHAQKAIALAGSRIDWVREAWLVVADAEEGLGNNAAARRIRREWRTRRG